MEHKNPRKTSIPILTPTVRTPTPPPVVRSHTQTLKFTQLSQIIFPSILITTEIHANIIPASTKSSFQEWLMGEKKWLDEGCLYRYLVACKWNVGDAAQRLEKTLAWRRSFQPHMVSRDKEIIEGEGRIGKVYLNGFDKLGQPIIYMHMKKVGGSDWGKGLKWSIFLMEKAIEVMRDGVEKINFIINYDGFKLANSTPMNVTRQWIDILSSHYPERLANGFHVNPNFLVWMPLKLINPFLDPVTRSKTQVVDIKKANRGECGLRQQVEGSVLESSVGGEFEFEYDGGVYIKELLKNE